MENNSKENPLMESVRRIENAGKKPKIGDRVTVECQHCFQPVTNTIIEFDGVGTVVCNNLKANHKPNIAAKVYKPEELASSN